MSKKLRALTVYVLLLLILPFLSMPAYAAIPAPWEAKIRPGYLYRENTTADAGFVDILLPVWGDKNALLFLNPYVSVSSPDSDEQSVGIGYRRLFGSDKYIFGMNSFFDSNRSINHEHYRQVSAGLEFMSKWVDFRANIYHPIGNKLNRVEANDRYAFGQTALLRYKGYEEALSGVDGELGFLVPWISNRYETHLSGGLFFYDSTVTGNSDLRGERVRVEVRPSDMINLNAEWRDDSTRGADTTFGVYLDLPFSIENIVAGKSPFAGYAKILDIGKGPRELRERMTERVIRDREIFAPELVADKPDHIADMIYVNADNLGGGDGSLFDPYTDINDIDGNSRWDDGVWIYVSDSDRLPDTYDDVHITLLPDSVLWGQGARFHNLGGWVGIPSPGHPVLDGDGYGDVVTLADNNTVMGFVIQNADRGIVGYGTTGSPIRNVDIHDNIIKDTYDSDSGIHINNELGDSETPISETLALNIYDNLVYDSYGDGIHIEQYIYGSTITDTTITNNITNNTLTTNDDDGADIRNIVRGTNVDGVVISNNLVNNNASSNSYDGIDMRNAITAYDETSTSDIAATVSNSSINNNLTGNTASDNYSGDGITISGYGDEGLASAISAYAVAYENVEGNVLATVSNSSVNNRFTGNVTDRNDDSGVSIWSNGISTTATLTDGADLTGDLRALNDNNKINNTFSKNTSRDNDDSGIRIQGNNINSLARANSGDITIGANGVPGSGNVSSEVLNSNINNSFDFNTATGNAYFAYEGDEAGILIEESRLNALSYVGNFISSTGDLVTVNGNVSARVDPSSVNNTFIRNTVSDNYSNGIVLGYTDECCPEYDYEYMVGQGYNGASAVTAALEAFITGGHTQGDPLGRPTGLTSMVEDVTVNNIFQHNTASGNSGQGIRIGDSSEGNGNNLYAGAFAEGGDLGVDTVIASDVYAEVRSTPGPVISTGIVNNFYKNVTNDNSGNGTLIVENVIDAEAMAASSTTIVDHDVEAYVNDVVITNIFKENISDDNSDGGLTIYDNYIGADAGTYWAQINGNVTSGIDPVSINNTFIGNQTNDNYDDYGILVEYNEVEAYTEVYGARTDEYGNPIPTIGEIDQLGTHTYGDVSASIVDATINNTVKYNTSSDNYGGIEFNENAIDAHASASSSAWIAGNLTASVDPSGINNLIERNVTNNNDDEGVYIDEARGSATALLGEVVENDEDDYYTNSNAFVEGDVTAEVIDFAISNTFNRNEATGNDDDGLTMGESDDASVIYARVAAEHSSTVGGDLTASTINVSIDTIFDKNNADNNVDQGIERGQDRIESKVDVNQDYYYTPDTVEIAGNVMAVTQDATIETIYKGSGNSADNHDYEGIKQEETEILANVYMQYAEVGGDVSATVDPSGITNNIIDNNVSNNGSEDGDDNIELDDNVVRAQVEAGYTSIGGSSTALVEDVWISNLFDRNITNNAGYYDDYYEEGYGDGLNMDDNWINANNFLYSSSVDGDLVARIVNAATTNTFTDNESNDNADDNIYIDNNGTASSAYVTNSSVGNEENVSDVVSEVVDSTVTNTFSGNTATGSDDGHGIQVSGNSITSYASAYSSSFVSGDVVANVDPISITNTVASNVLNDNNQEGVHLSSNRIFAETSGYGAAEGEYVATVDGATIDSTFYRNRASGSEDADGIEIGESNIWASASDSSAVTNSTIDTTFDGNHTDYNSENGILYGSTSSTGSSVAVNLFAETNRAVNNGENGFELSEQGGTFTGDLGGGALASIGVNSFYSNGGFDLENNSGTAIKAESNWWGANADPSAQILAGAGVDSTPWRTGHPGWGAFEPYFP